MLATWKCRCADIEPYDPQRGAAQYVKVVNDPAVSTICRAGFDRRNRDSEKRANEVPLYARPGIKRAMLLP